jgi:hypothetical protein
MVEARAGAQPADTNPRRLVISGVDGPGPSEARLAKGELAARLLLNRVDAIGIERDMGLDRGDRRVGLLVGPDGID